MSQRMPKGSKHQKRSLIEEGGEQGERKRLLVIDGHNLLFRAFHAITPLTTREGLHTHAIYGFLRMLFKLLRELNPTHIAVALDAPGPTFRHEAYAEYKAQRERAPDSFHEQVPWLKQLLNVMGITVWEMPGYEADDIMAAVAQRAKEAGMEVFLVTGDLDALQLVSERTYVLAPKRGITDMLRYDIERVKREQGVLPAQIPDLKALRGDPSDNIPGVPGIGEKTAQKLLMEYGSLEKLIEVAPQLPDGKLRELIRKYADRALHWRSLTLLRTDVPIDVNWDECLVERLKLRSEQLAQLLQKLEF
ncbi:MAG TPA: DNA polymerase I, partial [Armatimonadetes bacterium]|nr:DNA polymerase I [Armatimonadota bacterium]